MINFELQTLETRRGGNILKFLYNWRRISGLSDDRVLSREGASPLPLLQPNISNWDTRLSSAVIGPFCYQQ